MSTLAKPIDTDIDANPKAVLLYTSDAYEYGYRRVVVTDSTDDERTTLHVQARRASTSGGFYNDETFSAEFPTAYADRVDVLTKLAAALGVEATFA